MASLHPNGPNGRHVFPLSRSGRLPASEALSRSRRRRRRLTVPVVAAAALVLLASVVVAMSTRLATGGAASRSTARLAAAADTYASWAAPDRGHGDSDKLAAGSRPNDRKVIYLRFDARSLAGADVTDASLVLTRDLHHLPGDIRLNQVLDTSWQEATLTAATAPDLGPLLGVQRPTREARSVTFDLRSIVSGPGVYAFAVTSAATDDVARFRSRETGDAGPALLVTGTGLTGRPAPTVPPSTPSTAPPPVPPISTLSPTGTPTGRPTSTSAPAPAPPGTGLQRPTCPVSEILVPGCGLWLGIAPGAFTSTPRDVALRRTEGQVQRPFDVFHAYHTNDQLFPTPAERAAATEPGRPRQLYLNWKPATDMTWRRIADGGADARIDRLAAHIRTTFPHRFFLTIWHEPENDVNPAAGSGMTAGDFAAMFRHVAQRLRAQGAIRPVIVMNYMGYTKWAVQPWFSALYPGDDVVDWIGWDPYATGGTDGYRSGDFSTLVNRPSGSWPGFYNWVTRSHPDKPIMLAEWGVFRSAANPAGTAAFFDSVRSQLPRFPRLKGLLYFESPNAPGGDSTLDGAPGALAAFQRLARDPLVVAPQPPM
ncbi:MAG: DNRLRE domain-containing protein [Mycobacteriales bacterium]